MTNEIETYKKAKADLAAAKQWASMIGKTYYGGTSGKGSTGYLHGCVVGATVYYQERDGSTNYHNAPPAMCLALASAVSMQQGITNIAIELMQGKVDSLAQKAVEAHAALMEEAGLV